ncbi:spermidine/putrescine ABC transporter substrate-binding protein [Halobacteriovorax marinus]|uniref:Spermidine/putrescine ABC transporter substrate-binding protein n=1 Tax=Halobacteriovorax marinus TaxID=97084 RepID=A0A1Y5FHI2_9BACT|nr:spermidine/putrescine ABC transporter substrate-binding protein [Halobacteriovorax marinus]
MNKVLLSIFVLLSLATQAEDLRIFTWDGYITKSDLVNINGIFKKNHLDIQAKVISPFAEGSDQMFNVIRQKKCDVSFLTLFFVKMNREKITQLLQPINVNSKRLTNYKKLLKSTKSLDMGMKNGKPLYIPYGAGVYGFYVNRDKVKVADVPKSIGELWTPKWKGKFSLNKTQIWYNIGISLMALDMPPFYLNNLLNNGKRHLALELGKENGIVQKKMNQLYAQAGHFWTSGTVFKDELSIVSSWGPEIQEENKKNNGNWQKINFKEGNIVWLDTINFMKGIKGDKLIAAELMANYFMGKKAQERIVKDLSMISASSLVKNNPLVNADPHLFSSERFVPPYSKISDNLMQKISKRAFKNRSN